MGLTRPSDVDQNRREAPLWQKLFGKTPYWPRATLSRWSRETSISRKTLLRREYFKETGHKSNCPWKGVASYYSITVDGDVNADAAWYYPDPKSAAENIRGHVAFWRDVEVSQ
jgi:hypothetical protein